MAQSSFSSEKMEAQLAGTLQLIRPSGRFVRVVRQKINSQPQVQITPPQRNARALALIFGGALSVSLLVLTLARAFFYLHQRAKTY